MGASASCCFCLDKQEKFHLKGLDVKQHFDPESDDEFFEERSPLDWSPSQARPLVLPSQRLIVASTSFRHSDEPALNIVPKMCHATPRPTQVQEWLASCVGIAKGAVLVGLSGKELVALREDDVKKLAKVCIRRLCAELK